MISIRNLNRKILNLKLKLDIRMSLSMACTGEVSSKCCLSSQTKLFSYLSLWETAWRLPKTSKSECLEPVNVTLCGKEDFTSVTQLRILKWRRLPWMIRRALHIIVSVLRRKKLRQISCRRKQWDNWSNMLLLTGDARRGHQPRNARNTAVEAGESKGKILPFGENMALCTHWFGPRVTNIRTSASRTAGE